MTKPRIRRKLRAAGTKLGHTFSFPHSHYPGKLGYNGGFNKMERAGRILAKWRASGDCVDPALLARAAWRVAAGEKIAAHTLGANLVRRHLVVEVEDETWRRQLGSLQPLILRNLARQLGEGVVEEIEFRIAPRRKAPGRAEAPVERSLERAAPGDEAEGIVDPVLRGLYRISRGRRPA